MEAYPALCCGYRSAEVPASPPDPAGHFELEGPRTRPTSAHAQPPSSPKPAAAEPDFPQLGEQSP
jgi:hypothetical protein